jgi:hypothetical protein
MFRIRPKTNIEGNLVCCDPALGGRTPTVFQDLGGIGDPPTEDVTANEDGTFTTVWSTVDEVFGSGDITTTLCCSEILSIDLSLAVGFPDQVDFYAGSEYYLEEGFGTIADVHVDHPDLFPIDACGLDLYIAWYGQVTISITHGKD